MNVNQEDLVRKLREISSYERGYKQQAFSNAALAIEILNPDEFRNYINSGEFMSIRGIGRSVEKCIIEYVTEGKIQRLEDHKSSNKIPTPFFDV